MTHIAHYGAVPTKPSDIGEKDRLVSQRLSQLSVSGISMGVQGVCMGQLKTDQFVDHVEADKITFNQAVMTMILNCVGSGILFFPKVMADVGMIAAPLLCIICAAVCLECGTLISKSCCMAETKTGVAVTSYEDLANFVGGVRMERIVVVTKNFAMLGFVIVYFGLVSDSIAKFFPQAAAVKHMMLIRFGIVLPLFTLLAMLKNLKQLARFAILGIVAMVVECFGLVGGSLLVGGSAEMCQDGLRGPGCRWFSIPPPSDSLMDALGSMGKGMSIFLFSYAILATVPSVRSQLKDSSQMPKVLSTSFGFCALLNIFIMSIGYFAFGGNAPDSQNDGLSAHYPGIAMVVAVSIIVNLLLSTPLYSYCLISVFEASGDDALRTPLTLPNMAFRACLILALATTNHFLPYAMEVIGLVSSVFACANNIIYPVLFFYQARRLANEEQKIQQDDVEQNMVAHISEKYVKSNGFPSLFHVFALVVGCCVLVFGVQGSLETLREKIAQDHKMNMAGVNTMDMIQHALNSVMVF